MKVPSELLNLQHALFIFLSLFRSFTNKTNKTHISNRKSVFVHRIITFTIDELSLHQQTHNLFLSCGDLAENLSWRVHFKQATQGIPWRLGYLPVGRMTWVGVRWMSAPQTRGLCLCALLWLLKTTSLWCLWGKVRQALGSYPEAWH